MPPAKGHRRVKRILIASYGHVLVPELIKLLDEQHYCLFVLFNDTSDISHIQKAFGKKRLVPILIDHKNKSKDISEDLFKNLPQMDSVINVVNSSTISRFYDKRKRFKTTEMKLHKVTAAEVKDFVDTKEPCLLNLIPETTIGLTHMFEPNGIDVPISTHLSTSLRNSFRKIFQGTKTLSLPPQEDKKVDPAAGSSDAKPGRSHSFHQNKLSSSTLEVGVNGSTTGGKNPEKVSATKKLQRSLSLLMKKDSNPSTSETQLNPISPQNIQNQLWEKENSSYRKSLNKLHAEHLQRHHRDLKKSNSLKFKKQRKAEKDIEEEMKQDKGRLESKCNDMNATTLARSTALTPDTANRIIASREARVNKEVCRTANRKKIVEFEKIEETHKEKLEQVKTKHIQAVLKSQQESLERTQRKYQERIAKKTV